MKNAVKNLWEGFHTRLETLLESYAFKQPLALVQQFSQRVDELLRQLQNYLKAFVRMKRQAFETAAGRLHALSPLAILDRGYSLSFGADGALLKEARSVQVGGGLVTRLAKGKLFSKVTAVEEK